MELSLAFIATRLREDYPVALRDADGLFLDLGASKHLAKLPKFRSARLWTARHRNVKDASTLPIAPASSKMELGEGDPVRGIVWIGSSEPPKGVSAIWISTRVSAVEVLDCVLDIFEFYSAWNARVREALLERVAIPDVVKLLDDATGNPYWYADPALRVLQMSDDRSLSEVSEKWAYQRATGHYPVDVISNIVTSGDLEKMNRHSRAWLFDDSESYTIPFVTKTLFLNGSVYGYLFIIELNPRSCVCDIELAETLGQLIAAYVQHSNFGLSGTKRFAEQMLRACLAGNDVSDDERTELLDMLGWSKSPGFMVAAFDLRNERGGSTEAPQVQVELLRENLSFGRVFAYDVYIVFVTDTAQRTCAEVEERIAATCGKLGWKAGISDEFSDFSLIDDHYGQAQIALQKGLALAPDESTYPYRDYSLAYICQKLALEIERPLYMHPDVERLIAYDRETASELVATLSSYLGNERNISKTAKDLYLHRNSVIYRIEKIKSLMKTDLDDDDNRIALLISLKAWSFERCTADRQSA